MKKKKVDYLETTLSDNFKQEYPEYKILYTDKVYDEIIEKHNQFIEELKNIMDNQKAEIYLDDYSGEKYHRVSNIREIWDLTMDEIYVDEQDFYSHGRKFLKTWNTYLTWYDDFSSKEILLKEYNIDMDDLWGDEVIKLEQHELFQKIKQVREIDNFLDYLDETFEYFFTDLPNEIFYKHYNNSETIGEIIKEKIGEDYYNKFKPQYEVSIFDKQKNIEVDLTQQSFFDYLMNNYEDKIKNELYSFDVEDWIINSFIPNKFEGIYSVISQVKELSHTPSPEEMNDAYDMEYKFGKNWEKYLPDEVKSKYNIQSTQYIRKIKYKKSPLSNSEKIEIENNNISLELLGKALFSINKMAKIARDNLKKNYNIFQADVDFYWDEFDEDYFMAQEFLKNKKYFLYNLKDKVLKLFKPNESHLTNPGNSSKFIPLEDIQDLEQFKKDYPSLKPKTALSRLSKSKKKKLSDEEKELLKNQIAGYSIPIKIYEEFYYYEIGGYQFHLPTNNKVPVLDEKSSDKKIVSLEDNQYKQELLLSEEDATKIINIYLKNNK